MTGLLTKEERETVERAQAWVDECKDNIFVHGQYYDDFQKLLAIIDNLSKRGMKKYSEEDIIESVINSQGITPECCDSSVHAGIIICARFLGALEEK